MTEVRRLIDMIQYYCDLWPRLSHILEPFTAVSSGKKGTKITWTPELETAFKETIDMVCTETFLNYPDWSKPFDIHTDDSDYQLGAVISQDRKPIAFYSRKLNKAQRNYYAGGFIGSYSKKTSSSPFFGVEVFTIMSPI